MESVDGNLSSEPPVVPHTFPSIIELFRRILRKGGV